MKKSLLLLASASLVSLSSYAIHDEGSVYVKIEGGATQLLKQNDPLLNSSIDGAFSYLGGIGIGVKLTDAIRTEANINLYADLQLSNKGVEAKGANFLKTYSADAIHIFKMQTSSLKIYGDIEISEGINFFVFAGPKVARITENVSYKFTKPDIKVENSGDGSYKDPYSLKTTELKYEDSYNESNNLRTTEPKYEDSYYEDPYNETNNLKTTTPKYEGPFSRTNDLKTTTPKVDNIIENPLEVSAKSSNTMTKIGFVAGVGMGFELSEGVELHVEGQYNYYGTMDPITAASNTDKVISKTATNLKYNSDTLNSISGIVSIVFNIN